MNQPKLTNLADVLRAGTDSAPSTFSGRTLYQLDVLDAVGPTQRYYGIVGPGMPPILTDANRISIDSVPCTDQNRPPVTIVHHAWWYDADQWEPEGWNNAEEFIRHAWEVLPDPPRVIETTSRDVSSTSSDPLTEVVGETIKIILPPGPRPKRLTIDVEF